MNIFAQFLIFLQAKTQTPTIFGLYHIICFVVMIIICAVIIICRNKITQKQVRLTLFMLSITLIVLEILKQLIYSFNYNTTTNTATWDYQWYAFPFQFCSTPMYIMLIASLCKDNKFRDCLYSYLGTFALFAGLAVMVYPGDVFTSTIFINVQTMIWHSSMVIVSVLLWSSHSIRFGQTTILKASLVFITMVAIAVTMNYVWKLSGGLETGETFNMFYISQYYNCHFPILSFIQSNAPYIIFLLSYIIGFILCAYIILVIAILIHKIILKRSSFLHTK